MIRRQFLKLLGLLPLAPLALSSTGPVRVKQYANYVARNPKVYGSSFSASGIAASQVKLFMENQRRREQEWAAEFLRDGMR